jgi:phosphate transport system protein
MSHQFEEQLDELKNRMLFMGSLVELAIHLSVQAMCDRDEQPAMRVLSEIEPQVNDLHLELDDRALQLLSLRQPLAADLRFITSTMKINSDLERIGNQACTWDTMGCHGITWASISCPGTHPHPGPPDLNVH